MGAGGCGCQDCPWNDVEKTREEELEREAREEEARRKRREEDKVLAKQTELIMSNQSILLILIKLPRMINLTVLVLKHCYIDDNIAIHLADAMKNCLLLTSFDVQDNNIGPDGFGALIDTTNTMKISKCLLQPDPTDGNRQTGNRIGHDNVSKLLKLPPPIDPNIAVDHMKIGARMYPKVGVLCLETLCLSEMNLGDKGAIIVAQHFENLVSLTTLYFYHNAVGAEGAEELVKRLPNIRTLKSLSLIRNYIPEIYKEKFEAMNRFRESMKMPRVNVGLDSQFVLNNDEEAQGIARTIPGKENGEKFDFFSEGKKFTPYGRGLIEAANESRKRLGLQKLDIRF